MCKDFEQYYKKQQRTNNCTIYKVKQTIKYSFIQLLEELEELIADGIDRWQEHNPLSHILLVKEALGNQEGFVAGNVDYVGQSAKVVVLSLAYGLRDNYYLIKLFIEVACPQDILNLQLINEKLCSALTINQLRRQRQKMQKKNDVLNSPCVPKRQSLENDHQQQSRLLILFFNSIISINQYLRLLFIQLSSIMDQLLKMLQETALTFNKVIVDLAELEYKQQIDKLMDVEDQSMNQHHYEQFKQQSQGELQFFDTLPDNIYSQHLDSKISNIKMNSVSIRRKDQLFKRQKREQQQKIIQRRKQLQTKYPFNANELKFQGEFWMKKKDRNEIFAFKNQDFEKLRPETDLNDTIIDNYLKLMQISILSEEVANKTFIFSTFFMSKLLGDQLREDTFYEREADNNIEKIKKKVVETYPTMKRWTKKIDLFSMEYIVVPINAYKHWNSMIIVSPGALVNQADQCKIIYLDSMCEKKNIFSEAIKMFLQLELADRKSITTSLDNLVHTYQLLVPRQTNTHDCGLYTLCYIQYLLKNHQLIDQNMEIVRNREHLRLFPRSLIFTMRQFLRQLFKNLLTADNKEQAIKQFVQSRIELERSSNQSDFDEINERQFKKYYRLNSNVVEDKKKKQCELEYQCKVKFYLDSEVNHYEKDSNPQ